MLITNYSCNNRCKWCYTGDIGFPADSCMPHNYAMDVMTEMRKNGVTKCTIIGGEPTLYPYLKEIIQFGSNIGLKMKIVTNAVLLGDENFVYELIQCGISIVAISIHGVDPRMYHENTQTNNLHKVLKAIENCNKYNLEYVTLTTINKLNKDSIYDTSYFLNELGVKNIVYNIAVPTFGNNYSLTPSELADVIQNNYCRLKADGIKSSFYASIPLCLFNRQILDSMLKDEYLIPLSRGGCNIYDASGFAFDPNGSIIPCCKQTHNVLLDTMDNNQQFIYKNNFNELWNKIKSNFGPHAYKYPHKKCISCELNEECIGGCKLFWNYYSFSDHIK